MNGCRYQESCTAQLCPLVDSSGYTWFTEEDVCRNSQFEHLNWLKRQKALKRLHAGPDRGFFTIRMLDAIDRGSKKLKGLDPDTNREDREILVDAWIERLRRRREQAKASWKACNKSFRKNENGQT